MTHPLVPQIVDLATPVAQSLGLEIVAAVFRTNESPPVLQVNVRNLCSDTGLEDCERMSHALEAVLDETEIIGDAYVLEVSSPGLSRSLTTDREFVTFKGFPVSISTTEPHNGQQEWSGQLIKRDDAAVHINRKGRAIVIPRPLITTVQLVEAQE